MQLQKIEEEGLMINSGMPVIEGGSSNADLCSWKEVPFPKHLNNNPEAKLKYLREETDRKAALK
jgi:hypothetical protein